MADASPTEPASRLMAVVASMALVGLATVLRLHAVGSAFLFGDELWSLRLLSQPYGELFGRFDSGGAGLALPILQKASVDLFGYSLLAVRLPSLVPALTTVVLVAMTGSRVVSSRAALFAAAILATSSMHIFYSRFGRSYALVALLAYVFVANLTRILAEPRPSRRRYATAAVAGGLLPWVHVLATPFVGATAAATIVAVLMRRELRPRARPLLAASMACVAVALLLYLPAWEATAQFARERVRSATTAPGGPFDTLDVLTILAGSRAGAYVLAVGIPLAAMHSLVTRGACRLPLAVAALATLPLVYLVAPLGGAYWYARYAIPALPAMVLLLGELIADAVGRVSARPDKVVPIAAMALALGLWIAGPRRMVEDGPYANGYLSLVPLPTFDEPFPGMPDVYAQLEAGARIIEAPLLPTRAVYLYRNYYLRHRHPTMIGILPEEGTIALPGAYVVLDPPVDLAAYADYLVIHLDTAGELTAYFTFAQQQAASRTPHLQALVAETQSFWSPSDHPRPSKLLIAALTAKHGAPLIDDGRFLVYRLRPPR